MTMSIGSTPAWLATTRAAPESGTFSRPRILTRNQFRYRTAARGMSTEALKSGSNPNSSAWWLLEPSRRCAKSAATASCSRSEHAPLAAWLTACGSAGRPASRARGSEDDSVIGDVPGLAYRPAGTRQPSPARPVRLALLLISALDAGLLEQLAMLLLSHPLTALLDDGAHGTTFGPHSTERKRARSPAPRRQGQRTPPLTPPAPPSRGMPQ